jgi:hypothetical protein
MSRTKSAPQPWRRCRGACERVLESTLVNFPAHKTGRGGLNPRCRDCVREDNRVGDKMRRVRLAKAMAEAAPPLQPGQRCKVCEGLAHRRPIDGCRRCGLPYEAEPAVELVTRRSWSWAV